MTHRAAGFRWIIASVFFLFALASTGRAQVSFDLTDLGTLGGNSSSAASMGGQHGRNAAGMIVGTSKAADNSSRAFLYSNGQMSDLNSLCDLTKTNFAVLTAATSIDDDGAIIGEGTLTDGKAHAFLLTPVLVDGGRWSYSCCNWVWKQVDATGNNTGWWWEPASHRYNWHGSGGKHPACPPNPPHCWSWPLPCPPETGSTPYPTQTPTPTPTPGITPTPTPTPSSGKPPIRFPHNVGLITPTPPEPMYWVCMGQGVIWHLNMKEVNYFKKPYYNTAEEADAKCEGATPGQDPVGWCCDYGHIEGKLPVANCVSIQGTSYPTLADASVHCGEILQKVPPNLSDLHPLFNKPPQFQPTLQQHFPPPAPQSHLPENDNGSVNQTSTPNPIFINRLPPNSAGNLTPQNIPQNTPVPRVTPFPRQHGTSNPNITKGRLAPRLTPTPKGPPIHLRHPRPSPVPTAPVVR